MLTFLYHFCFVYLLTCQQEYERQQSKLEKMEKLNQPPAKLEAVSSPFCKHNLLILFVMTESRKICVCAVN